MLHNASKSGRFGWTEGGRRRRQAAATKERAFKFLLDCNGQVLERVSLLLYGVDLDRHPLMNAR